MDEVRYVPPVPAAVTQSWFYCLECGAGRPTINEIKAHWKASHEQGWEREAEAGLDYTNGGHFMVMRFRYEQWVACQAAIFSAEMHPGFGPEDFVAEAEIRE